MDYDAKLLEAKALLDRGSYTLAVMAMGKLLEAIYEDFYDEVLGKLPPAQRKLLTDREAQAAEQIKDRAAREKGFKGFTLGAKLRFFRDNKFIDSAEAVLGRKYPRFRVFDPGMLKDIRNEATHEASDDVDEDEATLFYSQIKVLLAELGYSKKPEAAPATAAGALHSWKDAGAIPHDDILAGNLKMDTYAADLWGVARNDANTPVVYRDPARFFEQTYLTASLKALLGDVLGGLNGGQGDRVLQLRTPFGGGKTHTLIALYHIAKSRAKISGLPADLPNPGACAVAAVQCEKLPVRQSWTKEDGTVIRTLWGEMFHQLGGAAGFVHVADEDANLTTPGGETIAQFLRELKQPTLILLDEILNYVEAAHTVTIGDSTFGRQIMVFLKNLTESVAASRNAVVVYSLQASVREGLGAEGLLNTLDHLVSRLDAKREPVSGPEVMRVVQRRLFRALGEESVRRQVAAAYAESFKKARQSAGGLSSHDAAQIAQDAERLQNRILESYPFHPDLLDLMYHRWGTLSSYQRTRGALQFLASVVYDLWNHGRDLQPLIGPGDVPLDMDNTRSAFFTQIGQREQYSSVLNADLVGQQARTNRVDRRIASDSPTLQRFRAGTRLATSVMLYSFGAREGEERGIAEVDLLQAAAVPGLDRMPLVSALNDLKNELLYLHHTGRRYRFETQANLNKLIDEALKNFTADDVMARIKSTLETELAGVRGAVVWPIDSDRVNDRVPMLQVVYLPFEWSEASNRSELDTKLTHWLEFCGSSRREYKNGLAFAIPNYSGADSLRSAARELLAMESIKREQRKHLAAEQVQELDERIRASTERIKRGVVAVYDQTAVPEPAQNSGTPYKWRYLELQSRSDPQLHARVTGALTDTYLLSDRVTPEKLIALVDLPRDPVQETERITNGFYSYLNFVRLTSADAVREAIRRGIAEGKLGYSALVEGQSGEPVFPDPSLVYIDRAVASDEIDLRGAYVISAQIAREATAPPPVDAVPTNQPIEEPSGPSSFGESPMPPSPLARGAPGRAAISQRYLLSASADKGKVSKLFRAIQNLDDKSDHIHIELTVRAEAASGFDPVWTRNAVEEPLDEADIPFNRRFE